MVYQDKTGALYCVNAAMVKGKRKYKTYRQRSYWSEWAEYKFLPWRSTVKEAESDLAEFAKKNNWQEFKG